MNEPENKSLGLTTGLRGFGNPQATAAEKLLAGGVPPSTSARGLGFNPTATAAAVPTPEPPTYSAKQMLNKLAEAPLYEPIPLHGLPYNNQISELRNLEMQYDRYCPECKKETPWSTYVPYTVEQRNGQSWLGTFGLTSKCGRCDLSATMLIRAAPTAEMDSELNKLVTLTKYGQWPALVSFHQNDLEKYRKVTTREQRSDFVRAVQAASQGFSAGACTYLRRVVESIKREALEEKRAKGVDAAWEAEFKAAKTNRQMEMLTGFLPEFLLKNKRLYNLLSEGLHNMTDDECRELFPNLRLAIELVFKGRQDLLTAREHEAEISKFIAQNDPGRA